jgi:propionate CoA-transferase
LDVERDVLSQMGFEPAVASDLTTMDAAIFIQATMGLGERTATPLEDRFIFHEDENVLFCNFEGLSLETAEQAGALAETLDKKFRDIGHRVHAISNYDNFDVLPPAAARFFEMIRHNDQYVLSRTRYSTNAFFRRRLGRRFTSASLEHRMYANFADARAELLDDGD